MAMDILLFYVFGGDTVIPTTELVFFTTEVKEVYHRGEGGDKRLFIARSDFHYSIIIS